MTIEEKRNAIIDHCHCHDCGDCKLYKFTGANSPCASGATDEQVEANYAYLFGNEDVKPDPNATVIEHPIHYKGEKYECIEVMLEVFGADAVKDFCLCNAFKYLWRCKKKHDNAVTDIKKAKFYLEKYIELEEGEANMNGK